jgi:hypothetical protein
MLSNFPMVTQLQSGGVRMLAFVHVLPGLDDSFMELYE